MKTLIATFVLALTFPYGHSQDFVEIEGNEIHYEIKGSGEPWIVLVGGAGMDLDAFDPIFEDLSQETTVVRYSRAGLGKSTYINKGKTFDVMVNELRLFINELAVPELFILGGHSFGGLMTRAYATKHPSKVAGLLSMDPAFEDNFEVIEPFAPDVRRNYLIGLQNRQKFQPDHAFTHEFETILRVYDTSGSPKARFKYPSKIPHFVVTSLQMSDLPNSPGRGSKEVMKARAEAQYRAIADSNIHMQVRVDDAGHEIYRDRPQLVVDSFKMLLNLVRAANER
jgi:pimeloyl-ACP methyl ester carboxylesterase